MSAMMLERVPLYPLAPRLPGRGGALRAARWRATCASSRTPGPLRAATSPGRLSSLFVYAIVQVRMFRDLDAGLLHAAIFWGFVILTIGTADRVTFGLVEHDRSAWPLDGWLWRLLILGQNMLVLVVLVGVGYALFRRLVVALPAPDDAVARRRR